MFHRVLSAVAAAAVLFAISVNSSQANYSQQQRPHCKGFFNCLFGSSKKQSPLAARKVKWLSEGKYSPGSIVVMTQERALYYVLSSTKAIRYPVGVGREGFTWSGHDQITRKKEWPGWTPPDSMIMREARKGRIMPSFIPGGPQNPLGARALYIGTSLYRIHGTNDPSSIGLAMSSGCIRMMNDHVVDLYDRVKLGAQVYVYQ